MSCSSELPPLSLELVFLSAEAAMVYEKEWGTSTGLVAASFNQDVRNLILGTGASVEVKPAIQYAAVRTDRPDDGGGIAGTAATANGITRFDHSVSAADKFFWRRGLWYKLTGGSFARCEVLLHTAVKNCGRVFPARELVINPFNSTADVAYFPLTEVFACIGVDKAKAAIMVLDSANADLEYRLAARGFTDKLAPGSWTDLEAAWHAPTSGDSSLNPGEVSLSGLSLNTKQWMQLAPAVRKSAGGDPNSRAILRVIPAITYA